MDEKMDPVCEAWAGLSFLVMVLGRIYSPLALPGSAMGVILLLRETSYAVVVVLFIATRV